MSRLSQQEGGQLACCRDFSEEEQGTEVPRTKNPAKNSMSELGSRALSGQIFR